MKKTIIAFCSVMLSANAMASSIYLDDMSCSQTDFQPFEMKLIGSHGDRDNDYEERSHMGYEDRNDLSNESRVSLEFSYKFGGAGQIDCSRLYEMALRQKENELEILQRKLAAFQSLEKIDWSRASSGE